MAPSFGRSISFQLSPSRATRPRAAARHVRSISLPCPRSSDPLLSHLHAQTAAALAWATTTSTPSSGLAVIDALHAALAALLLLPEPQALIRRAVCASSSDRLLDAFLLLADAHRGFQESLLALRLDTADACLALRRRDAARLASASRAQRRGEKDLARLAAAVSSSSVVVASRSARLAPVLGSSASTATAEEAEMAAALMDAVAASAAASAAVFSAVASVSAAATSSSSNKKAPAVALVAAAFANKKPEMMMADVAPEKIEELQRCIDECESGSEVVFRSIVRTRVSLLNIRTPAI